MEAATWTAIAIPAGAMLGTLFHLGARIDGLGDRIDGLGNRVDALGARLDARIDAQAAEIRDLRADLTARLDEHIRRHAG